MKSAQSPKMPSERGFGTLITVVLAGIGVYGFSKGWGKYVLAGWLVGSGLLGLVTLSAPRLLSPFNRAWFLLGQLLGKIVNPIILGIIFFGLLTPVAFIARLVGRDELRLKKRAVESFWVDRAPSGPDSNSFKNQF